MGAVFSSDLGARMRARYGGAKIAHFRGFWANLAVKRASDFGAWRSPTGSRVGFSKPAGFTLVR